MRFMAALPPSGVLVMVLSAPAAAVSWFEVGDAGDLPATAQITAGVGTLDEISGSLSGFDDIDMYRIGIQDPGQFAVSVSASLSQDNDAQLFVFDLAGALVFFDDDGGIGLLPAILPGELSGLSPGDYYLTINLFDTVPADNPITGWLSDPAPQQEGPYVLMLNGVVFAVVSEIPGEDVVANSTTLKASSPTTVFEQQRGTTTLQAAALNRHISSALRSVSGPRGAPRTLGRLPGSAGTGIAAGEELGSFGLWLSYARSNTRDTFLSTAFKSQSDTWLGGVDRLFDERVLVGIAFSRQDQDVTTVFNSGSQDVANTTVAPYLGVVVNDNVSADFSVGYTDIDIDQDRLQFGRRVRSNVDGTRWFAAANVNGYVSMADVRLGGSIGLLYARDRLASFVESNGLANPSLTSHFMQGRIGGELAYAGSSWEPYLSATFAHELKRERVTVGPGQVQPPDDRNELQIGAGVRYFGANDVTGSLDWVRTLGRANYTDDTINLTVRVDF